MFKATIVVVYCDPEDRKQTQQTLEMLCRARENLPLKLTTDKDGDFNIDRHKDVVFVLSSSPSLMFYNFNQKLKGPQALVMPYGETIDTMKEYLTGLTTFDDMPVQKWIEKAQNNKEEFAASLDDDKNEVARKESLQRWFSMDRFTVEKKFYTTDMNILKESKTFVKYINDV